MSSKQPKTRPERRHNLDKRAAPRLHAKPTIELPMWDTAQLWKAALARHPTLRERLYEGWYLFADQPGIRWWYH